MRTRVSVVLVILVVASSAVNCFAQAAGSSVIGVTATELREVETGWSAKKQILGRDVYSPTGDKIGSISDLIVLPNRSVSYAIVGVGGFIGMGKHDVAVPVSQLKEEVGKIVLPGATKEALKAAPEFKYAK